MVPPETVQHRTAVHRQGYTLIEVLVSMLIVGISVSGIVAGFMQSHAQAEWSAYSLAAQSLALQPVEQARVAKWDPYAYPAVDQVTNLTGVTTHVLDVPITGTNIVYATNRVTVTTVSVNPPLKKVYVETTWRFMNRGIFTNAVITCRAPDQ